MLSIKMRVKKKNEYLQTEDKKGRCPIPGVSQAHRIAVSIIHYRMRHKILNDVSQFRELYCGIFSYLQTLGSLGGIRGQVKISWQVSESFQEEYTQTLSSNRRSYKESYLDNKTRPNHCTRLDGQSIITRLRLTLTDDEITHTAVAQHRCHRRTVHARTKPSISQSRDQNKVTRATFSRFLRRRAIELKYNRYLTSN